MENQISEEVKEERTQRLINLSNEKKRAFYEQCAGQERPVLVESQVVDDMLSGFTDNYIRVQVPYNEDIINTIQTVTVDPCRTVL
jgi:threonylcarbamoyladenosine tRNA methylthiotransferase MtaB